MGLEALELPEATESFVFLFRALYVTLSEGKLAGARLGSDTGSPRVSVAWGLSSCAWALASIISWAGAKGQDRRCRRSGAQGLGSPRALGESCDPVRLG
jgi:hypothetical protein